MWRRRLRQGIAEACMESIVSKSVEASVYRNKVLELAYESGTKDEYGDVESPGQLRVLFKSFEPVTDEDIIIAEEVRKHSLAQRRRSPFAP